MSTPSSDPAGPPEETPTLDPIAAASESRQRNLLAHLLDPRSIQRLLAFGGGLTILGLVILLWANEYFTTPVVAFTLATANMALLAGGWSLIRGTRYQIAGRALTLLACLIMPLNLWYYQTHDLMSIDGHLWVAALVISVLYAASALVLRDETFVYVFVGGIALTGLLILADLPPSPTKFWEIASPSTLLVVLGLISMHVERAFPETAGPFSRRRFGLAFFWSGHAALAAGLLLVLAAQVAANWLYQPIFKPYYEAWHALPSPIVTEHWGQILALCLVVAGIYAYLYSDVVVRLVGVYIYVAAGLLLWAEVLVIELLHIHVGIDFMIAVLAGTGLVVNFVSSLSARNGPWVRPLPVLGALLALAPVGLGALNLLRAIEYDLGSAWKVAMSSWAYVGAMLLTAVSCGYGALLSRTSRPKLMTAYSMGAGAAALIATVAFLAELGLGEWQQHALLVMLVPMAFLLAARLQRGKPEGSALLLVADAALIVVLLSSLPSAIEGFTIGAAHPTLNLVLGAFFAEAAVYFGLQAGLHRRAVAIHAGAATACAAVWQMLTYLGVEGETYTLTFAAVGVLLLLAYRLAAVERFAAGGLASAAFQSANALLSLSFTASIFMGLSRLAEKNVNWQFVALCLTLGLVGLVAVALVRASGWRRWYAVTTVFEGVLAFFAVQILSTLSIGQKLEVFGVVSGLAILILGHVGWLREKEAENDLVTLALLFGSLLAVVPLAIATCVDRWEGKFLVLDDIGFFAVSVVLLASGFMFRLRATTLTGGLATVAYFVLLLLFVPWKQLNSIALMITMGGGVIFASGLMLSVFRDRLLALPERIKRREGIYRVLSWR